MSDTIIVAIISAIGTGAGAVVSVLTASKLTEYKIQKLEEEVRKHNDVIERTFRLEARCDVYDEKFKDLEGKRK